MANKTVLILANGDLEGEKRIKDISPLADYIIATDGAWEKAEELGIKTDLVIGDLDSLTAAKEKLQQKGGIEVEEYPREKDWTDLELAVDRAISLEPERIIIYGALGGRLDHTLANISLLEKGLRAGVQTEIVNDNERAVLIAGEYKVPAARGGDRISLLAVSDAAILRTKGLKYALNNEPLNRWSTRGISNEVSAIPVSLDVSGGLVLVIHARRKAAGGKDYVPG
jgi:thiamine pyrophosphokinase